MTPIRPHRRLPAVRGLLACLLLAVVVSATGAAVPAAATTATTAAASGSCACTEEGDYEGPAGLVAPHVESDGSSSAPRTGHTPAYRVSATGSPPAITLVVRRLADSATVLTLTTSATNWGFSPDEHRFVTHRVTGGMLEVQVYDLAAADPSDSVVTHTAQTSEAELGFSPDGGYFGVIHLWASSSTTTGVTVYDAVSGRTAYSTTYSFSVAGSAGKRFGAAGWGFSPAGHGFLLAYVSGASTVEANLVDLHEQGSVFSETLTGSAAHWHFSPCGSAFALVTQNDPSFMRTRLLRVADGEVLATRTDPVATIRFSTTEESHLAHIDGSTHVLAPNPGCPPDGTPTWPAGAALTAGQVGPREVTLSWTAATDDVAVTRYRVLRGSVAVGTVTASQRTLRVTGLEPGSTYAFSVRAGDADGNWTADGPSVEVTTPAEAPTWPVGTSLVADDLTDTSTRLRWTKQATDAQGVTGYRVYRDGTQVAVLDGAARSHALTGLTPGTTYTFSVQAVDADGNVSTGDPQTTATTDDFEQIDVNSARGTIYVDRDRDGSRDGDENGISGYGYSDFSVNAHRVTPSGAVDTWTSVNVGTGGHFSVDNLEDGTWVLSLTVWPLAQTNPADLQPQVVQISGGRGWAGVDFGVTPGEEFPEEGDGAMAGSVFEDRDVDGVRDAGEPPVPGAEIACYNEALGSGCGATVPRTDDNGHFEADALLPGTLVVLAAPAGTWYETSRRLVRLGTGEAATGVELGVVQGTAAVAGKVFHDDDADGGRDSGEEDLTAGWICAHNVDIGAERCATPSGDGSYLIDQLPPGTIEITVSGPEGWTQTPQGGPRTVTVAYGDTAAADLGMDGPNGVVRGVVFADVDRDAVRDEGEQVLSGASVCLVTNREFARCTHTDALGRYRIGQLASRYYAIDEGYAPEGHAPTVDPGALGFELGPDAEHVLDLGYAESVEPGPPGPPEGLTATAGDGTATLRWTAPADDGGAPVVGYDIQRSSDGQEWHNAGWTGSDTLEWAASGLENGTTVWFRVNASNSERSGEFTAPVAVTPGPVPPPPPGPPTQLVATAGDGEVTLTWQAPEGEVEVQDYRVEVATTADGWVPFADGVSPRPGATVTGLPNGVAHRFRVAAVTSAGAGPWSDPVAATPQAREPGPTGPSGASEPSAPRTLQAVRKGPGAVRLRWAAPASAGGARITDYVVQRRSGGRWVTVADGRSARRVTTVRKLRPGTHRFRVAAVSSAGRGAWSEVVRVRVRR